MIANNVNSKGSAVTEPMVNGSTLITAGYNVQDKVRPGTGREGALGYVKIVHQAETNTLCLRT